MNFRCNICRDDGKSFMVMASTWDSGMSQLQDHINEHHGGAEAVAQDISLLNLQLREKK